MINFLVLLLLYTLQLFSSNTIPDHTCWTSFHKKIFSDDVRLVNSNKKNIFFEKLFVSPFTQLIFSWNALRPTQGHFSFFIQVRDAETKQWGNWHLMADWGAKVQRTYASKSNGLSSYVHVRLEVGPAKTADGFRVRVESCGNAPLNLLYGLSATTSHFNFFRPELAAGIVHKMKSVCIQGVPKIAQFALSHNDKGRICSPVSCSMVTQFITGIASDPLDFSEGVFDAGLSIYGSWACNVAHAFDKCSGKVCFFVKRCDSFMDLYQQLAKGMPVIVSVRGTIPGALKSFPHGHLIVVIGWDENSQKVLCHDPAAYKDDDVFKQYQLEDFLQAWEKSHRLMYGVEKIFKKN